MFGKCSKDRHFMFWAVMYTGSQNNETDLSCRDQYNYTFYGHRSVLAALIGKDERYCSLKFLQSTSKYPFAKGHLSASAQHISDALEYQKSCPQHLAPALFADSARTRSAAVQRRCDDDRRERSFS